MTLQFICFMLIASFFSVEGVCMMGGSVRCLSWQVKGANMDKILDLRD